MYVYLCLGPFRLRVATSELCMFISVLNLFDFVSPRVQLCMSTSALDLFDFVSPRVHYVCLFIVVKDELDLEQIIILPQ